MQKDLPIYNYVMLDDKTGIDVISFVSEAAMEETFVALSAETPIVQLAKDKTRYELTAPVIVPERLIRRNNIKGGPGYAKFSAAETDRVRSQFMRTGRIDLANTEHDDARPVDAQLVELWAIEDPQRDKSAALGFKNLPKGTLMATYRVNDPQYWADYVETSKVTGFSLQGNFGVVPVTLAAEVPDPLDVLIKAIIDELLPTEKSGKKSL
ncbi:hypothetical protein Q5H93_06240 [Hymenobacter sp. ASUV-10]|uniref:Phage tail protein n=1 Tax=Hymenobacter aranciens TaxID=3063996 RepID=A0ABT9B7X5_9BACT|nr:hypothetical protein [Hymenobacter sp. ASUV-10]MDO7874325.1 hypothetical protein [Hymenobacter sp. ASUV-10]